MICIIYRCRYIHVYIYTCLDLCLLMYIYLSKDKSPLWEFSFLAHFGRGRMKRTPHEKLTHPGGVFLRWVLFLPPHAIKETTLGGGGIMQSTCDVCVVWRVGYIHIYVFTTHCNTLQHTATHCNKVCHYTCYKWTCKFRSLQQKNHF